MIASEDLAGLMRAVKLEAQAFLTGRFGVDAGFTQADDMTIFGPFGGPAPNMPAAELTALQQASSKQFEFGETTFEVVKTIVSDDLVVLVMIERNNVRLAGGSEFQSGSCEPHKRSGLTRTVTGGDHRHADPLVRFRPGDETFALARAPTV